MKTSPLPTPTPSPTQTLPPPPPRPDASHLASLSTSGGRQPFPVLCRSIADQIIKAPPLTLYQASSSAFLFYAIVNPQTFFGTDAATIGNRIRSLLITSNSLSPLAMQWAQGYNAYRVGHSIPANILFASLLRIAATQLIVSRLSHYNSASIASIPGTNIRPVQPT